MTLPNNIYYPVMDIDTFEIVGKKRVETLDYCILTDHLIINKNIRVEFYEYYHLINATEKRFLPILE